MVRNLDFYEPPSQMTSYVTPNPGLECSFPKKNVIT